MKSRSSKSFISEKLKWGVAIQELNEDEVVPLIINAGIVKETAGQNLNLLDIQTVQEENTKKDLEAGQEVEVDHHEGKKGRRRVQIEVTEMAMIVIVGKVLQS